MTIESLGRKGGPKPGDLGPPAARHGRRPQPETRVVPAARPKPAPPRQPLARGSQGQQPKQVRPGPGPALGPTQSQAPTQAPGQGRQAPTRIGGTNPAARPGAAQSPRDRAPDQGQTPGQGPAPNRPSGQQKTRGRGDGKADNRGERSLYDGGSPSANRLGPAKAMRARDVSRPRDW